MKTYKHQFRADSGCRLEGLSGAMDDRDRWQKRIKDSVLLARLYDDHHIHEGHLINEASFSLKMAKRIPVSFMSQKTVSLNFIN